jgi:glycosyltransferase involved in cell wall biosynthesis
MRILWIKVGGLWPLDRGGRLRSFHILSELSRRHALTLLTSHGPEDDPAGLQAALGGRVRVLSWPHQAPKQGSAAFTSALLRSWASRLPVDLWRWRVPALRGQAARLLAAAPPQVCVADFLAAVPNLPPRPRAPVALFEHNVEHVIWQRLAALERRPWRRLALELESRKMRRFEAAACRNAELTFTVSDADGAALARLAPDATLLTVPTGVDTSYFVPRGLAERPGSLVFTGAMDWYPNEDAVVHFVASVLPRIRRERPATTLTVAGRNPPPRVRELAGEGVNVTGSVDDVRPFVESASVYVVPLRVGGGTRLKVFEALAMGKALVSTSVGVEGLPVVPGEHFVLADTPEDFAREVGALLADGGRRRRLGAAGRRLVEQRYSWPRVSRSLESGLREVMRHAG